MNETRLTTVAQLRAFLKGSLAVEFTATNNDVERYGFISAVLQRFRYGRLCRSGKGVVLRYLERITGYSRQQLTRLVGRSRHGAPLAKRYRAPVVGFARKFTAADVALLAHTDAVHDTLSGPATRCLLQRAYTVYGDARYTRLATISVAHLYNLRRRAGYQAIRTHWTKTKGRVVAIGERRAPTMDGRPGYIRIDSVHQGDEDGHKGLYHINAVDCATQFESVATCEGLSEAFLLPVLQQLLAEFPFVILGFHADNGSEYINHTVAKLLEKLRIEFTKSRPRHSNDNGLVETKNGAIVRKVFGYGHIPQHFAAQVNAFCQEYLNPYINFHRPCYFPTTSTDAKGKVRKHYRLADMTTPYAKLRSLPGAAACLPPRVSMNLLMQTRSTLARIAPLLFLALVAATVTSCAWLQDRRDENKGIHVDRLKVPPGYKVALLASEMPMARHMAMGTQGTLFVGSMAGNVYALSMNGSAVTQQRVVVKGLRDPSGVAFKDGTLFVADRTRIVRFDGIEQRLDAPGAPVTVIDGLPDKARHDAHAMGFGPDGKLYVAVGSPCDTCEAKDDEYGVILRINPDGSGKEVFARGIRNSVGFDWHPQTRELWFTENGGDALGLERPNDELNRVVKVGENFGFPYCHDGEIPDPEFGVKRACSEFSAPAAKLGAHVAALGMRFDTSAQSAGDVSMIIARHGSHPPIRVGYDVVRVRLQAGQPQQIEPFLTGFLEGLKYWGRPVDVLVMRDGSVLVSDDLNGAIYRITRGS